ncbi:MAG: acyl carrier protein [Lachnospiraceae bacterium]|nr:acyl carrier protein [Lachnospiraceae bacterium]
MDFDRIRKIIASVLGVDVSEVKEETTFIEDLGADSLDVYQIMLKLEEEFEIHIDAKVIENIRNVGDVLTLIRGN